MTIHKIMIFFCLLQHLGQVFHLAPYIYFAYMFGIYLCILNCLCQIETAAWKSDKNLLKKTVVNLPINLIPSVLSYPSLRSEKERPWLGLVMWLQNKMNSEGDVLCLSILCLVHTMIAKVCKSKIDLLTL